MADFHGINDTANNGQVLTVSATKVKARVMNSGNPDCSGISFFIDYTKGTETSITLTATMISYKTTGTTDEYTIPLLSSGALSALTITLSATGKWVWPIAVPALAELWVVLTMSTSGSADSTTVVTITAALDTIHGK